MIKVITLITTLVITTGCTYNELYVGYKGSLGASNGNVRVDVKTSNTHPYTGRFKPYYQPYNNRYYYTTNCGCKVLR